MGNFHLQYFSLYFISLQNFLFFFFSRFLFNPFLMMQFYYLLLCCRLCFGVVYISYFYLFIVWQKITYWWIFFLEYLHFFTCGQFFSTSLDYITYYVRNISTAAHTFHKTLIARIYRTIKIFFYFICCFFYFAFPFEWKCSTLFFPPKYLFLNYERKEKIDFLLYFCIFIIFLFTLEKNW